jgi:hypothetical protein
MFIKEGFIKILNEKNLTWFGKLLFIIMFLIEIILCFIAITVFYIPYLIFVVFRFFITGKFKLHNFYEDIGWHETDLEE